MIVLSNSNGLVICLSLSCLDMTPCGDSIVGRWIEEVKRNNKVQEPHLAEHRFQVLFAAGQTADLDAVVMFERGHSFADDPRLFDETPEGDEEEPNERIENDDAKQQSG